MTARSHRSSTRYSVLLASAIALALAGCSGSGAPAEDKQASEQKTKDGKEDKKVEAVPVEVAMVAKRPISARYSGTATLEAPAESQVVAKTSGVVLQILAEEGDIVQAGQVLARIDADRTRLEMERARASMNKLENNYRRSRELLAQKLVSTEASDQIRYDLESAKASYELARLELSYTNIVAPISGVIAQRMIKPGNLVGLNAPAFRIVDNSKLEAVLNVPERELATLKPGLPVRMGVDAIPGETFSGVVDRVSPVVDAGSGTFRVVTRFQGQQTLRPGMFGRVEVIYDQRADVLTLPRTALLDDESEPAVYVVRENKANRVGVRLGYVNGELAEVRDGVKEGDRVVTAGKVAVRDGTLIEIIESEAEAETVAQLAGAAIE